MIPPAPPTRKRATVKEAIKVFRCALFHQKDWQIYTVCVEPHVKIAVCCKCGTSHLIKKGFTTAVETDIKIDKLIKEALE